MRRTVVGPIETQQDVVQPSFRVLIADPTERRLNGFTLNGSNYLATYADTLVDMVQALDEDSFDLVFASCFYVGYKAEPTDIITPLALAHAKGTIRGVVITTACIADGQKQVRALKERGVPATFIPFNWNNPQNHIEWRL